MPVKFTTISNESLNAMEESLREGVEDYEATDFPSLFAQFKMYQENRLKINKDSRESKMAARKEGGGGSKRGASAKMTGVVKLVAIEGQENTFKVEKVSIPVPAPQKEEKEEENLAENPEALAAAVAEAEERRAAEPVKTKHVPKPRGPAIKASQERKRAKEEAKKQHEADLAALAEGTYVPRPKKNNLKVVQKARVIVESDPEATESEREDDE